MRREVRDHLRSAIEQYGWTHQQYGREFLQKDGYEVYFYDDNGFELTIRDPDTMERRAVFTCDELDPYSPAYVALLEHILSNVEDVVLECLNEP